MSKLNIGIDIDGVLFPWDECARDAVVEKFGGERLRPSTSWDFIKENLPADQWAWLWSAEGQDVVFGRPAMAYYDAVEAVNAILKRGHGVHFVTHRDPRRTAAHTSEFLERHFGGHPWNGVHIIQAGVAKRTLGPRWDVFVDDKPDTVFDFLANTEAMVFAPVRLWNLDELANVVGQKLLHYDNPQVIVDWVEAHS